MVFNKYKRAEGYELKEQPEGGGGRLPTTNCGQRGRKGGGWCLLEPGSQGPEVIRSTSLSTTQGRTTEGNNQCAGDALGRARRTELGRQTISIGSGDGQKLTGWFLTRLNINCTLFETIKLSKYRLETVWLDRGLWEMNWGF